MTARDLIKGSLRLIGVIASGETPSGDQSNDALAALNSMIRSWNIDGLMVFKTTRESFSLTSGQSSRTMGTGGNFNTTRPSKITGLGFMINTVEYPLDIINVEQYAAIPDKTITSSIPLKVYIEGTYPLETLNIWPVPDTSGTMVVYSDKAIVSGDMALTDTISLPNGYEDALKYNLSVRLAPEYGRQLDQMIWEDAKEFKAAVMRQNTKPAYMTTDAPGRHVPYNIFKGS